MEEVANRGGYSFPGGSVVKNLPGDGRKDPHGEGNGNPFQYSCLGNLRQGTLAGYSLWSHKGVRHNSAAKYKNVHTGAESIWKISVTSAQFCCEPEVALKTKVYLKKESPPLYLEDNVQISKQGIPLYNLIPNYTSPACFHHSPPRALNSSLVQFICHSLLYLLTFCLSWSLHLNAFPTLFHFSIYSNHLLHYTKMVCWCSCLNHWTTNPSRTKTVPYLSCILRAWQIAIVTVTVTANISWALSCYYIPSTFTGKLMTHIILFNNYSSAPLIWASQRHSESN